VDRLIGVRFDAPFLTAALEDLNISRYFNGLSGREFLKFIFPS
jgi:hypothetical protein